MRKRLVSHVGRGRLKCLDSWLNELASLGMKPTIELVAECNGYFDGLERERIEIARYVEMHGDLILNRHHRIHASVWMAERQRERDRRRAARIERRDQLRAERGIVVKESTGSPRSRRCFRIGGITKNMSGWASVCGITRERMRQRFNKFSPEQAVLAYDSAKKFLEAETVARS
jgi:hypothetical protein